MTTTTYSSPWAHNSVASFVAWGSALSAALQTAGLHQTSDTGQIAWGSVSALPAVSTAAGYEIYAFTDTLQSTSPIYVKIEYGTGAYSPANGGPSIWITVGNATNGAGTITGTNTGRIQIMGSWSNTGITTTTTPYPTFICFNGSYLGVVLKSQGLYAASPGTAMGTMFMIGRGTDVSGNYVAQEVAFICTSTSSQRNGPAAPTHTCVNFTTNQMYSDGSGAWTMALFSPTFTSVNGTGFQTYPCWAQWNQVLPLNWAIFGLNAEIPAYATVKAAPFGSTVHTYLMTGPASYAWGLPANNNYSILMLWE